MTYIDNPFKSGTIVDDCYFTDRVVELDEINRVLKSPNHLALISPRRYGKSSLVKMALRRSGMPSITLNMQQITGVEEFAAMLLKGIFRLHPMEKLRYFLGHFRVVPTITTNPLSETIDLSFPVGTDGNVLLEDVMGLLEATGSEDGRTAVVLDEFQDILHLSKGLDKKLRAMIQEQKNVNYIFLGSQESMMKEIFERKTSPFYHFGNLMYLKKIQHDDYLQYISARLQGCLGETDATAAAEDILRFTSCHPYYTQQLAAKVWELTHYDGLRQDVVTTATEKITTTHDYDYERLWLNFNLTDRRTLQHLAAGHAADGVNVPPTSTVYSSLSRLAKKGYVVRDGAFDIKTPS